MYQKNTHKFSFCSLHSNLFSLRSFCMYGKISCVPLISSSTFFIYIVYSKCCCRKVDLGKGLVMANTFFLLCTVDFCSGNYVLIALLMHSQQYKILLPLVLFVPCVQNVIGTSRRTLLAHSTKQFTK